MGGVYTGFSFVLVLSNSSKITILSLYRIADGCWKEKTIIRQESKLYGAHFREIDANAPKATKIKFGDSDNED
ncbi:hypothetical protein RND71_012605 [Anisodus tanguticus]|uniref:Uncharacterized protein n=1 Tax=Anisodus tanguticus TaxID=243964 RepID=A0AAE1VG58_9SOLA|nr:hypothetical protein RND71_012605 [Anisodus tanguticus]